MKAWELLSNPRNWTTRQLAQDAAGLSIDPLDERAVAWCAEGAIRRCYWIPRDYPIRNCPAWQRLTDALYECHECHAVPFWNDEVGYATVFKTMKELDI